MLSLTMIVKGSDDEATYLDTCLKSVANYVDEIIVVVTQPNKAVRGVAAKYGSKIFDYEWKDDFADARNFAMSKATGDWIIWLDADDVVVGGENLREICANTPPHIGAIYINYDYEVDADGTVKTKHWRERLLRNDGSLVWKGRVHETPVETRRSAKARTEEVNVVHTSKPERWDASEDRNIRILTAQLEDESASPDPRTIFYLAVAYKAKGDLTQAKELLEMYLKLSGWDEERCVAWCNLAEIHLAYNHDPEAIDCYLQAIKEREDMPMPYVGLGEIYAYAQKNGKAINWLEQALRMPEPSTSMLINPLLYTYRPLLVLAGCYADEGELNKALECLFKAQQYKDDEGVQGMIEFYNKIKGHKLATEAVTGLAQFLDLNGQRNKIPDLLKAIPDELHDNPLILKLRRSFTLPKKWAKQSVVIFTGSSVLGEWGPWSLDEGIGGSEEAIIRLSKRLLEQGYSVSVYATPGDRAGSYDGVQWHNYWELDLRDKFDIFVAWRSPWFFDATVNARKKYLWLHDVMEPGEFTPERLANLDKVIVLSEYHRSLFPDIPDDKILMSANGIDAGDFEREQAPERDPHTVVYQSSHVRGLSFLYDIWPKIVKRVPDAKLRVMYGWESFIGVHKNNPERLEWMEMMKRRAEELPGVSDIGKVSQDQIVDEILAAGVWAYPCPFPEIFCITALKNQAGGAIPVSSTFAALQETVRHGYKIDLEEWTPEVAKQFEDAIVDAMTKPFDREAMAKDVLENCTWTSVAAGWIKDFEA